MEIEENLDIALEIISTLIQNKEISKAENQELYQKYVNSSEIGNLTDRINFIRWFINSTPTLIGGETN